MSTRAHAARSTLVLLVGAALLTTSCGGKSVPESMSTITDAAGPLLGSITSAVPGLSQAQAVLGAGSLLGPADAKMPDDQFDKVEDAIPGAESLMNEAVTKGLPKPVSSLADVTAFLGKSGITPDQVTQLVPVLGNAVKGKIPDDVSNAFMAALQ